MLSPPCVCGERYEDNIFRMRNHVKRKMHPLRIISKNVFSIFVKFGVDSDHEAYYIGCMAKTLGDKIKELRSWKAWSLAELSAESGVSEASLSRIECGRQQPTYGMLKKIAKAFDVKLGAFDE